MEALDIHPRELILLSVIGLFFIIQVIYYLCIYIRIYLQNRAVRKGKATFTEELPPLSVVICARNESHNLREFLPSILEQDYPNFEVIVINDGSADESEDLLSFLEEKYPHLYHSFTPDSSRYISHKKLALTLGVKASKHDWLVFTEANCFPESKNWLRLIARNLTPGTEIVLGYSGYERGKGWFNKRTSFDTLFASMRYLGFAIARRPYMGIGRNMAYRKELFFREKGFSAHLSLQRGDDDLFINQIATRKNTRVETNPDATIRMKPLKYHKEWKEEKVSYVATSKRFKGSQRFLLGFETMSRLFFYAAVITTLALSILDKNWIVTGIAALIWVLRYILQAVIINKTAKELGEKRRYYFSLPLFDLYQPWQSFIFKAYRRIRGKGDFMRR